MAIMEEDSHEMQSKVQLEREKYEEIYTELKEEVEVLKINLGKMKENAEEKESSNSQLRNEVIYLSLENEKSQKRIQEL